jgi:HEAT repeat protein
MPMLASLTIRSSRLAAGALLAALVPLPMLAQARPARPTPPPAVSPRPLDAERWSRFDREWVRDEAAWSGLDMGLAHDELASRVWEDAARAREAWAESRVERVRDLIAVRPFAAAWATSDSPATTLRTSPPAPWAAADPADSLYRQARDLLNRGDYRRAAQLFRDLTQRFPKSDYAPEALYWDAFARYRIGSNDELRRALESLDQQRQRFPEARSQADASALATRIRGALAARGDAEAAAALEREARTTPASGAPCDQEDQAVRSEALSALAQADLATAMPIVRKVLARRDECSAALRRRAMFIVGQRADTGAVELLADAARTDPVSSLRSDAVLWLARIPGDRALAAIDELLRTSTDERVQRAAVRALAAHPSPRGRQMVRALIERADANEALRAEAIGSFDRENASAEDAAFLRGLYPKLTSQRLRERAVAALARMGGAENEQWLLALARNADEPVELRAAALRWTARSTVPIAEAVKLYEAVSERPLREQLIEVYGYRKEPAATDKLIDIAKNGTDPQLRRRAISALTRKNDPRTTKLLMEIIGQ